MKRREFVKVGVGVLALSTVPLTLKSVYRAPPVRSRARSFIASPQNKGFADVGGIRLQPGEQMIGYFDQEVSIVLAHRDDVISMIYVEP